MQSFQVVKSSSPCNKHNSNSNIHTPQDDFPLASPQAQEQRAELEFFRVSAGSSVFCLTCSIGVLLVSVLTYYTSTSTAVVCSRRQQQRQQQQQRVWGVVSRRTRGLDAAAGATALESKLRAETIDPPPGP